MFKFLLFGFLVISLTADTTICFKKNWSDPANIEMIPLDGGKCAGDKTVSQMKKNGWKVDDIKLTKTKNQFAINYIYVLKTTNQNTTVATIKNSLEKIQQETAVSKKIEENNKLIKQGKKLYLSKCIRCHGAKAQEEAYNTSRALVTLSLDDMRASIRAYSLDEKNNGMAILMKPYAEILTDERIEAIYKYIQTLK